MRVRLVSWFVLLSLMVLMGAQLRPASFSHDTSSTADRIGKQLAADPTLVGVVRFGTGEKARKVLPLVTTCTPSVCTRVSLAPPLIDRTVTAVPRSHTLPIFQRISVYRI